MMSLQFFQGNGFWKSPSGYKPGGTLTIEKLNQVERLLNVTLPESYVRYMLEQNGGELAYRYVLFDDGDAAIVPFLYEVDMESGVGLSPIFIEECGLPEGLVLVTGDLESWIALDYRNTTDSPQVVYFIATEHGVWEEHVLAPNFEAFTNKLFQKVV
ncbi:SMI1/KNR4 family protein [bacterium LRH843]|nr:SMI1/KNR4 family protein [bacterium LRH843]